MDRRDFLRGLGVAGGAASLSFERLAAADQAGAPPATESGKAYRELLSTLREVDETYLGPARGITRPQDIFDGHRLALHVLGSAIDLVGEVDPERPVFQRMVSPTRKFQGDNPDSIYYSAYIRPDRTYRIRGNIAGATYTSISWEIGSADGNYPTGVARAINDAELGVKPDGSYALILGPEKRPGNWFKLDPGVGSITTRHYFETKRSVALDPSKVIPLTIEPLDDPGPAPAPTDESVAASIRRVSNWVRGMTIDQPRLAQSGKLPRWVSTTPNQFNPPEKPDGDIGFANRDAAYAMAPYAIGPDQALIIEGRFPKGRFANVMLWNRFLQTYDYVTRRISLNRRQTKLESDGSFKIVVAHRDPGGPNWLDASGRASGLIYWRFVLPEAPVAPLKTRLVALAEAAGH